MTPEQLEETYRALSTLREYLDDDANVPERYESTLAGALASSDASAITTAIDVVHRLMLAKKYPEVSRDSYFAASPVKLIEAYSERAS